MYSTGKFPVRRLFKFFHHTSNDNKKQRQLKWEEEHCIMDLNPFTLDPLQCTQMLSPEIDNKPNMTSLKRQELSHIRVLSIYLRRRHLLGAHREYYIIMQEFHMVNCKVGYTTLTHSDMYISEETFPNWNRNGNQGTQIPVSWNLKCKAQVNFL